MPPLQQNPIPCPDGNHLIFVYPDGNVVPHYGDDGYVCKASCLPLERKGNTMNEKEYINQQLKQDAECTQASTPMQGAGIAGSIRQPSAEEDRIRQKLYNLRSKLCGELSDVEHALQDLNDPSVQRFFRIITLANS